MPFSEEGWPQLGALALAFVLSALIGLEREYRHKSAGLRTHSLVGLAAALIVLVSKYGFLDTAAAGRPADPARVAAQIVSGIGFIGAGVIFVRRDSVRGLTTAAIIWLTAAVGMACGAGLPILALAVTAGHFIVVFGFPYVEKALPSSHLAPSTVQLSYEGRTDILPEVLAACAEHGFAVSRLRVDRGPANADGAPAATAVMEIHGLHSVSKLAARLAAIHGVLSVHAGDTNVPSD